MEELLDKIAKELITSNEAEVKRLVLEALDKVANAREILDNGLLAGMDVVGKTGRLQKRIHLHRQTGKIAVRHVFQRYRFGKLLIFPAC